MCQLTLTLSAPLPTDFRIMCEIERILRRGASTPHNGYSKDKVGGHKLKIQEILDTLNAPSSPLDETRNVGESAANLAPVDPHRIVTTSVSESGTSRSALSTLAWFISQFGCSSLWTSNQTRVCPA